MKYRIFLFLVSLAVTLSLGSFERVLACSLNQNLPSVCEMYGKSAAVFIGKVTHIEENRAKDNSKNDIVYLKVEESFLGIKKEIKTRVVLIGSTAKYCGFARGQNYLVYAFKVPNGDYNIDAGTRTRHISDAAEDLDFLRNLPNKQSGVRLYGNVKRIIKSSLEDDNSQPLANVTVKIENFENKQIFKARTDLNGDFHVTGLPAGSYDVGLNLTNKFFDASSTRTMKINDKGCVSVDVSVVPNSQIKGRIIDAEGNPVKNVTVEVISINIRNPDYYTGDEFGRTDEEGFFNARQVPPGLYTISINANNPPESTFPFPPTFYPGVSDRSQAQIIEVNLGQNISDIVFRLPPKLTRRNISGSVVWRDGTPAAGVKVYIKDHLHDVCCLDEEIKTDEQGRFIISGFVGRKYRVWAVGKRFQDIEIEDYGVTPPFILNDKTPNYTIILDKTESWLTEMDDDNEKELQNKP